MPFKINVPAGLTERSIIVSGGIKRQGFPSCGVVYSTSVNPSPDDFDTDLLTSCKIAGPNGNQFDIVGGYYMERHGTTVTTTHCFGAALDPSQGFEINEGGQKTIGDSWDHLDSRFNQFNLNEREPKTEASGWTFIVRQALDDRDGYPLSGEPMEILAPCPAIDGITMQVIEETNETKTVKFTADTHADAFPSMAYRWDLGNGYEKFSKGPSLTHVYKKEASPQSLNVSVVGMAPAGCNASIKADMTVVVDPRACSQLVKIDVKNKREHGDEYEVEYTANVKDAEAEQYIWDFGDGERGEGKTVTHLYKKAPTEEGKVYRVTVTTVGPDGCSSQTVRQMVPWPLSMGI